MFYFKYIQKYKNTALIIIFCVFAVSIIFIHFNSLQYFNFYDEFKVPNSSFKVTKFKSVDPIGRGYFDIYENKLFLMTGDGKILFIPIKKINKKRLTFKKVKSNFKNIIGVGYGKHRFVIVKNILIKNNKIYVSIAKKVNEKCYVSSILVSDLDINKIFFREFFSTNECSLYNNLGGGGNLHSYKKNTILMALGDWNYAERYKLNKAQNTKSLFGKIIAIREKTKEYKILSIGHRNQQGLFYDEKNDVIFSTEHGP